MKDESTLVAVVSILGRWASFSSSVSPADANVNAKANESYHGEMGASQSYGVVVRSRFRCLKNGAT